MTRKSRREIERKLDALDDGTPDADDEVPDELVINYQVVGPDGDIVDTYKKTLEVGSGGGATE